MTERIYDNFEDELDAIRIGIYEEIKDMTPEERVNYFHEQTAPMIKELGLEYSTLQPVQPRKRERIAII